MILDKRVRHKDIGSDLAAPADFFLITLDIFNFIEMLTLFDLNQFGLQHTHGHLAVLMLASLHLTRYNDTRRDMGQTHSGRRFIDFLSACTAGSVIIYF
ncbi:hypothetical protein SDC9_208355 [bioreactor metagenome]|uniref:Uncharacterized protein n=1 Tax=bioreactor metagenome TaxID=1076179 RepID=A0A645JB30_9ZZZZ